MKTFEPKDLETLTEAEKAYLENYGQAVHQAITQLICACFYIANGARVCDEGEPDARAK